MQEQNYGIPYAMHAHDIGIIGEFRHYRDNVNGKLEEGWVLLYIGTDPDNEVIYVMGKPRPKICVGSSMFKSDSKHMPETMLWDHDKKDWYCPHCGH